MKISQLQPGDLLLYDTLSRVMLTLVIQVKDTSHSIQTLELVINDSLDVRLQGRIMSYTYDRGHSLLQEKLKLLNEP